MKKLVVIGANNFQVPLIRKAKSLGFETHVFAWEKGAVGKEFAERSSPMASFPLVLTLRPLQLTMLLINWV
jgi:hypothetical protein